MDVGAQPLTLLSERSQFLLDGMPPKRQSAYRREHQQAPRVRPWIA